MTLMVIRLAVAVAVTIVAFTYLAVAVVDPDFARRIGAAVMVGCPVALAVNALRGKGDYKHDR